MAWTFETKGVAASVLADINGINAGSPAQMEVNSVGYAQTLMRSSLTDLQNKSLVTANNSEFHIKASGQTGNRHVRVDIFIESVPLDGGPTSSSNVQTPGVNA